MQNNIEFNLYDENLNEENEVIIEENLSNEEFSNNNCSNNEIDEQHLRESDLTQETKEKGKLIQQFISLIAQRMNKEKILVIDRFEGNFAVCEDRETQEMHNIEISKLPEGIKEGDVLRSKNNKYELDEETRLIIENRIKEKMKNLFDD